jgi:hypothetical protein
MYQNSYSSPVPIGTSISRGTACVTPPRLARTFCQWYTRCYATQNAALSSTGLSHAWSGTHKLRFDPVGGGFGNTIRYVFTQALYKGVEGFVPTTTFRTVVVS